MHFPHIHSPLILPYFHLFASNVLVFLCRSNVSDSSKSGQVENEKRVRREIANCNERRRMQSINAGFENLRILLPPTQDGEKLSKVGPQFYV